MHARTTLVGCLLAVLSVRPAAADGSRDVDATRFSLELAVREIDRCCDGEVAAASLAAQRRWAYALLRLLVLGDGELSLDGFALRAALARQVAGFDPAQTAHLAVQDRAWLERDPGTVDPAARGFELDAFAGAMYLDAVFEVDLMRAVERYRERVRSAEDRLQRAIAKRSEMLDWTREQILAAAERDQVVDPDAAFSRKRQELDQEQKKVRQRIAKLQKEFVEFDTAWKRREAGIDEAEFLGQIGSYREYVLSINQRIEDLTGEMAKLEKRKRRFGTGDLGKHLDEIERPPATRPVLAPAARED